MDDNVDNRPSEFHYSSLIIDCDEKFIETIRQDALASSVHQVKPIFARTASEVQAITQNRHIPLHSVYINPASYNLRTIRLVSLIHRNRPVTPIYFLYDLQAPFPQAEMKRIGVHKALHKPLALKILNVIFHQGLTNHELILNYGKKAKIPSGTTENHFGEYIQVPAIDLLTGVNLYYDIYVRNGNQEYEKIIEPNDPFTTDQIRIHMDKGVDFFYLKRQSHERLITYCDELSHRVLSHPLLAPEVKLVETFNMGQDIIDEVKTQGVNFDHVESVIEFSQHIRSILPLFKDDYEKVLGNFLNNIQAYDHAVTTTILAGLISLSLQLESESIYKNVSIASFFHDIGLYTLPQDIQTLSENKMSEEQMKLYQTHPLLSAQLLKTIGGLDETVLQAVSQHHEKRDRSGFPGLVSGNRINKIAEIIGISEAFIEILNHNTGQTRAEWLQKLELTIFPKFSFQVVEGFKFAFGFTKRPPTFTA